MRHGETAHNANNILSGGDCDVPLNFHGQKQSHSIHPTIKSLSIDIISYSPLVRAKQTMEIVTEGHNCERFEIKELRECLAEVWIKMTSLKGNQPCKYVNNFFKNVIMGINRTLVHFGTPLVVAHGGIHWALCYHMSIENHPWEIGNCELVHFQPVGDEGWEAEVISANEVAN